MGICHYRSLLTYNITKPKGEPRMAKCKCRQGSKIVSNIVSSMNHINCNCKDVCASPICADPCVLGIMAPLIYDEIGINLCAQVSLGVTIPTEYATATNATARVINATYEYGTNGVEIETITARSNCYDITLRNITVQFAMDLYDASCRRLGTIYPTAVYLPSDVTAPTYDEDTNPTNATLRVFAPYGLAYSATEAPASPTPIIQFIGMNANNSSLKQGINMFAMAKLLDLEIGTATATIGLTLVLQSVYYVGYKVKSLGKIDIPKGSIIDPEDSDCLRFVEGDLLNLAIKPLDLGKPEYEEYDKEECPTSSECGCSKSSTCSSCVGGTYTDGPCNLGAKDDTNPVTLP